VLEINTYHDFGYGKEKIETTILPMAISILTHTVLTKYIWTEKHRYVQGRSRDEEKSE